MGFKSRLKRVRDEGAPIERRVTALCNAVGFSHLPYHEGISLLETSFGIRIGQPITNEQLIKAADYIEKEWETLPANNKHGNQNGQRT